MLAYGQTGSGKTYTMGSENHERSVGEESHGSMHHHPEMADNTLNENDGLIPRFMSDIFSLLTQRKASTERILRQHLVTESKDVG